MKRNSITKRIAAIILLFGMVVTCFTVAIQTWFDYEQSMEEQDKLLEMIEQSYVPGLSRAVFDFNEAKGCFSGILLELQSLSPQKGLPSNRGG